MPKAPEGMPGQQGWEMFLPPLPFTTLTEALWCGLWFSQAQLETGTEILKCNVSLQPPPCAWLHTHSLEGPQPQPQNCRDSILFVRPANPPIHKKGSQLNLVFWVTFLAWWLERWCRSSYIRGYIASWNKSDLGLWDPRRCSALTSCWCKSSSSPGSFPLCLPAALTVVVSAAIKGQFRWAQVGNIWHDRREKKEEIGNCKGFK